MKRLYIRLDTKRKVKLKLSSEGMVKKQVLPAGKVAVRGSY